MRRSRVNPTYELSVRDIRFCFRLPADDARWLAVRARRLPTTRQRFIILALHALRYRYSDDLALFLTDGPPPSPSRPRAATTLSTIALRFTEDEARWVFVQAALRLTSAPKLVARLVHDIRHGGSPLLSELMTDSPHVIPAPLETPDEPLRRFARLRLTDLRWLRLQADSRSLTASQLLPVILQDLRAGGAELVPALCAAGDGRSTPYPLRESKQRLSFALSIEDSRWLNVAAAERLISSQEFVLRLVSSLRFGGSIFLSGLLRSPRRQDEPSPRAIANDTIDA